MVSTSPRLRARCHAASTDGRCLIPSSPMQPISGPRDANHRAACATGARYALPAWGRWPPRANHGAATFSFSRNGRQGGDCQRRFERRSGQAHWADWAQPPRAVLDSWTPCTFAPCDLQIWVFGSPARHPVCRIRVTAGGRITSCAAMDNGHVSSSCPLDQSSIINHQSICPSS